MELFKCNSRTSWVLSCNAGSNVQLCVEILKCDHLATVQLFTVIPLIIYAVPGGFSF